MNEFHGKKYFAKVQPHFVQGESIVLRTDMQKHLTSRTIIKQKIKMVR